MTPDEIIEQSSMTEWKKAYWRMIIAFCRRDAALDPPDAYADLVFEGNDETGFYADSEIGRFKTLGEHGKWGNHIFMTHPFCWSSPYNNTLAESLTINHAKAACCKEVGLWQRFMERPLTDPKLEMARELRKETGWGIVFCCYALAISEWDCRKARAYLWAKCDPAVGPLINSVIKSISDETDNDIVPICSISGTDNSTTPSDDVITP